MNSMTEAIKGFTDLPLVLIALGFGLFLRKMGERRWQRVLLLAALAGTLGTAAHVIRLPSSALRSLWTVLYALLFGVSRQFVKRMVDYLTGEESPERCIVWGLEAVLYAASVCVTWIRLDAAICPFVVFLTVMFVRLTVCTLCHHGRSARAVLLLGLLAVPIVLQTLSGIITFAVAAEHVFLAAAELVVCGIAAECVPTAENGEK